MNNSLNTASLLFSAFEFIFGIWWLVLVSPITAKSRRRKRNFRREILGAWVFLAVLRGILLFNPAPMHNYFVPEPLNTILFVVAGIGLFTLYLLTRIRNRQQFLGKTGSVNTVDDLFNLTFTEFEDMVVELYRMNGHEAKRTGAVGDHGVDVVVQSKNGEKWIVQCKRRRGSVGEPVIRDFYGTMQHEKADKGTVITAGYFSRKAVDWAQGKPISLYDGDKFLKAWKQAQKQGSKVNQNNEASSLSA